MGTAIQRRPRPARQFNLSLSRFPLVSTFAMLLVCEACPVSVAVRPERLSVSGSTRDSGHHSRFVRFVLLLAAAARGMGVDGADLLEVGPSSEPLTQGSEGRRLGAALH
jgi:hypothetical protein